METNELKNRASNATENDATTRKEEGKSRALSSDRTVWVVFFSLLVDLLAFTVILPLFPSLLEFYASNKQVLYDIYIYISFPHV